MEVSLPAIKQFEYTDALGWSVSRYDKFQACKRQYYYDYYGKYDTEFPRAKLQFLKQMTSMPLEAGNIVHDTIKTLLERFLRSEDPVNRARFLEYVRAKTREAAAAKVFAEVYFKEVSGIHPDILFTTIEHSLLNFLNSERYRWIIGKAIRNKNGWIIEPPGYGETRIDGMKAYCKVDFLFPVDGGIHILDWKTGKQDERKHSKQLLGYSAWASYHFERKPEEIFPMAAYLQPVYSEMPLRFTDAEAGAFIGRVRNEREEMLSFCRDADRNVPKNKEEFPLTSRKNVCRFCNYRELCTIR